DLTGTVRRVLQAGALDEDRRREVERLATLYGFFAWELAFPEVFASERSGFDVVLGNPPWERVKLQEKEWFAARDPAIANARNASERGRLIRALTQSDPSLHAAFLDDKRRAEGESHFARNSGRYPLTGRGDINTYPLFAELGKTLISSLGRMGMVLPTGIATDDTTKYFFQAVVESGALVSLFDFENRKRIFPTVAPPQKFCLLTLSGDRRPVNEAEFIFFALDTSEVRDPEKRFTLTPEDIALLNPNTRTCPVFRTRRDAEITKAIYRRVPVLVNEVTGENRWGISFMSMFHMSNDSGLFRTKEDLERAGFELRGNRFVLGEQVYLPLYEPKLFHQYSHRFNTYKGVSLESRFRVKAYAPEMLSSDLENPASVPLPRYWVASEEVRRRIGEQSYVIAGRNIINVATNRRTTVFTVLPRAAANNAAHVLMSKVPPQEQLGLLACLNSFMLDFVARQKLGGNSFSYFVLFQLPVLQPSVLKGAPLTFLAPRLLELIYTAWDL